VGWCRAVDADFIQRVRAFGLGLAVWTIDDEAVAQRLLDHGLPELMTNRPGYLRQKLRGL
jgi:glycerophosphoryl diester phosphodiesterase